LLAEHQQAIQLLRGNQLVTASDVSNALARVSARRRSPEPRIAASLRAYPIRRSVRRGETLRVCVAYAETAQSTPNVDWEVLQILEFGSDLANPKTVVAAGGLTGKNVPIAYEKKPKRANREELGYG